MVRRKVMEFNMEREKRTEKEKVRRERYRQVRGVLQLELNTKNCISICHQHISNSCSNIRYDFIVVHWNLEKIKRIDRKIRKLMALKEDVSIMYIPRKEERREMTNLEMAKEVQFSA